MTPRWVRYRPPALAAGFVQRRKANVTSPAMIRRRSSCLKSMSASLSAPRRIPLLHFAPEG